MMPVCSVKAEKQPLRIGVDIRTLNDGKHGIETSGIQTAVISLLDQLQQIDTVNEYLLFETRESNYRIYNSKWKKLVLPTFRIPGILWLQFIFPFYLLKHKIDVFWATKFICPFWLSRKIKVYTTVYDLSYLHFPKTQLFMDKIKYQILVPPSLKRSTAIIVDSLFIKRDIEKNIRSNKTPVIALPLGKPDWTIPSAYSSEKRQEFLFFAGNIEPRKNLINAIKALEILYSRGKSIELHIASPAGWKNRELHDYIERSPIKSNIKLLGFLSCDELKTKYLTCKALLYPSFYEGFGLPVLEALVFDCTVLTSQNTVMQEIAENTAVYFNPFDPYDIAEKILLVFSEGFKRDYYLKQKNKVLEKYSWETSARRLLSVFESSDNLLLSGRCSTR